MELAEITHVMRRVIYIAALLSVSTITDGHANWFRNHSDLVQRCLIGAQKLGRTYPVSLPVGWQIRDDDALEGIALGSANEIVHLDVQDWDDYLKRANAIAWQEYTGKKITVRTTYPVNELRIDINGQTNPEQKWEEKKTPMVIVPFTDITSEIRFAANYLLQNTHTGNPSKYVDTGLWVIKMKNGSVYRSWPIHQIETQAGVKKQQDEYYRLLDSWKIDITRIKELVFIRTNPGTLVPLSPSDRSIEVYAREFFGEQSRAQRSRERNPYETMSSKFTIYAIPVDLKAGVIARMTYK